MAKYIADFMGWLFCYTCKQIIKLHNFEAFIRLFAISRMWKCVANGWNKVKLFHYNIPRYCCPCFFPYISSVVEFVYLCSVFKYNLMLPVIHLFLTDRSSAASLLNLWENTKSWKPPSAALLRALDLWLR